MPTYVRMQRFQYYEEVRIGAAGVATVKPARAAHVAGLAARVAVSVAVALAPVLVAAVARRDRRTLGVHPAIPMLPSGRE